MPKTTQEDPVARWREIQDHRYDPGYWTGGRIDPTLTAKRPNRGGYLSIVSGVVAIAVGLGFLLAREWALIYPIAIGIGYGIVAVLAGIRIVRRPRA